MKPTKMRNNLIYQATYQTKSKQLGSALSKELHKKYGKRSVRVIEGDSVKILRGEFKGVDGKIAKVSTQKSSVAIEGVKKEKTKGDKFDVYIHTSNLVVTSLNSEDKWRISKLEGKDPRKQPKTETKSESTKETPKETKGVEKSKKEGDKE
ncbi:MAG: 50S ribosomal protein L24 [Nitrosopumilus sp.]|nr:50S ribosomal protein L24 [Nitrosopumilus sp.]